MATWAEVGVRVTRIIGLLLGSFSAMHVVCSVANLYTTPMYIKLATDPATKAKYATPLHDAFFQVGPCEAHTEGDCPPGFVSQCGSSVCGSSVCVTVCVCVCVGGGGSGRTRHKRHVDAGYASWAIARVVACGA